MRDVNSKLGAWFAGYICGLIAACAPALTSGCWHTVERDVECRYPTTFKSGAMDCAKLQTIAGKLPAYPEDKLCVDDVDRYWSCRVMELSAYAAALHSWSQTAIAVCAP